MTSRFAILAAGCGLLFALLFAPLDVRGAADSENRYAEPNFTARLFNVDALSLEEEEREALVAALAALAGPVRGAEEIGNLVRRKALAVALRLDNMHLGARRANDALIAGAAPELVDSGRANAAEIADFLWAEAMRLREGPGEEEDAVFYPYLMDIALAVDPEKWKEADDLGEDAVGRAGLLWRFALGSSGGAGGTIPEFAAEEGSPPTAIAPGSEPENAAATAPETPVDPAAEPAAEPAGRPNGRSPMPAANFARNEVALRVVVFEKRGGESTSAGERAVPCLLRASVGEAAPESDGGPFFCEAGIGPEVAVQLDAARGLLQKRHAAGLKGVRIDFELESLDDGRALPLEESRLGVTLLLLLDALFTGADIDSKVSLGGVLPAAQVKTSPRGRWGDIVEAAGRGGASAVIVSQSADEDLTDLLVSGGLASLLRVQVIEYADAGAAAAFLSKERDPKVDRAMELFGEVESLLARHEPAALAANDKVLGRAREVLELFPNHLSAKLLLKFGEGKVPERISLRGSVRRVDACLDSLQETGEAAPVSVQDAACADSIFALRRMRPSIAEGAISYADAAVDLAEKIRAYIKLSNLYTKMATDQAAAITAARSRVNELRRDLEAALNGSLE